jgi:hypothetical protein
MTARTFVATTSFILVAALSGCAGVPRADHYTPPPMGSAWAYQVTSTGSFGSYVGPVQLSLSPGTWQGRPALKYDNPTGALLQDDQLGTYAVLNAKGDVLMSYEPPLSFRWPLEVGKTWTQQITLTVNPGNQRVPMTANWAVEAYEDVTVPAGTFKAWRVVMTDNFGFRQVTWSVPTEMGVFAKRTSERAATHPQGGAGTQLFELTHKPTRP